MSYPYYYPYYSARQVYAPSAEFENNLAAIRTQQLIREQAEMEYAVRQKEELLNNQRLREYEDELRTKQRINDIIVGNRMEAELEASKLRQTVIQEQLAHQDYLRKLDHLRVERNLLERSQYERASGSHAEAVRAGEGEQENQRRIQQYQQELLSKITGGREKDTLKQSVSANAHARTHDKSVGQRTAVQQNETKGGQQVIVNKRTIESQKPSESQTKIKFSNPVIEGNIKEGKKRSQTIDFKKDTVNQYRTLDVKEEVNNRDHRTNVNSSLIDNDDYLKNKYLTERKKDQNRASKRSRKANRSQHDKHLHRNRSCIEQTTRHHSDSFSHTPKNSALQKIQKRLKLSAIVYKDSKLKNTRHQLQHLFNTFETQLRLRKEVRDRINNHPRILKKHLLVVGSR